MNLKSKIQSASLDRRITIRQVSETIDSYGDTVQTWSDAHVTWAHINNTSTYSTKENVQAGRETSFNSTVFTVRYNSSNKAITAKQRVRFDNNDYEIINSFEVSDARNRFIKIDTQLIK